MRKSRVLGKLRAGQPVLITNTSLAPVAQTVEMVGLTGFDGVWIDLEHRDMDATEINPMILAGWAHNVDTMVRVRKDGYTTYFRPLESGATGIMVPHVTTEEEARWIVRNAKFPPIGRRGFDGAGRDADYCLADPKAHMEFANRETFVAIQIEDAEAMPQLDKIAAVEGIDILFIGPADLTISLGIPFEMKHPRFVEVVERVASAAKKNGKFWGLPVPSADAAAPFLKQGARFIACGADLIFVLRGLQGLKAQFDPVLQAYNRR
jgi:4-hydroxy-2-oxoheptanedioate aldolase